MGEEPADLIEEFFEEIDLGLVEWQASEFPQLVPCLMRGTCADMIATPNLRHPGFHLVFSFFCPLEKAMASPAMVGLGVPVRYALLKDEVTAYRFWLHGYGVYTDQKGTEPHGLEMMINPRIPNDRYKPPLCIHCYLSEIKHRYAEEGRSDELAWATEPMQDPDLKGGLVFDASEM